MFAREREAVAGYYRRAFAVSEESTAVFGLARLLFGAAFVFAAVSSVALLPLLAGLFLLWFALWTGFVAATTTVLRTGNEWYIPVAIVTLLAQVTCGVLGAAAWSATVTEFGIANHTPTVNWLMALSFVAVTAAQVLQINAADTTGDVPPTDD